MSLQYFMFLAVVAVLFVTSNAASWSQSCVWINGVQKCTDQNDPNGNMAGSAAAVNGGTGFVGAGAGSPGDFNVNYDQTGYDEDNGAADAGNDYQPGNWNGGGAVAGAGAGNWNGGGVAVGTGGGYPGWNGNPFDFVRDFFGRGRR